MKTTTTFLFILVTLTLSYTGASATTIHVPSQYLTIQAGLAAAGDGDIVLVAPDVYMEHDLVLPDGVTLRGDGVWPNYPTIHADGHGRAVIASYIYSEPTRLEKFYITGSTEAGLYCENAHFLLVDHCHFQGEGSNSHGIKVIDDAELTLTNSSVSGWAGGAVSIYDSNPIMISDSVFQSNSEGAISFDGQSSLTVERCLFQYNGGFASGIEVYGWAKDGRADAKEAGTITDCQFLENTTTGGGGVVNFTMANGSINNCEFRDNEGDYVIGFMGFNGGTIDNCEIVDNTGHGVFLWDHVRIYLTDTIIANNTGHGIDCMASTHPNLDRTTIANNGGDGVSSPTVQSDDYWRDSIIAFNGGQAVLAYDYFDASVECMDIYGNLGGDWEGLIAAHDCINGNFSRDPLFCDASGGDFTLAVLSPCLPANNGCTTQIGAEGQGCNCATIFTDDLSMDVAGSATDLNFGVALGDYNGDGLVDVFMTGNSDTGSPVNKLFRNQGGNCNVLEDFTWLNSLWGIGTGRAAKWADYDMDGDLDLFVTNTDAANQLFRNDGLNVPWPELASTAGVTDASTSGRDAAWADYDGDGDLDLYLANTGDNRLFRNDGGPGWSFTDVAGDMGVADAGSGRSTCWADYDNDGDQDLFVANVDGTWPDKLYRNDGGFFTDVNTPPFGTTHPSTGADWGDYDNDGDLDLYVVLYGEENQLFENQGSPGWSFVDVASAVGLDDAGNSRAATWVDFDNDGDLDLHLADWSEDHLFRNDSGVFVDISAGTAIASNGSGRGVGWGDLDNDGRLDCIVANYDGENVAFMNLDCSENRWLQVELVDNYGRHNVIGARVRAKIGDVEQIREVNGGSGYFSQNWMIPHFGLGTADMIDELEVRWPDGESITIYMVAADQRLSFIQGVTSVEDSETSIPERYALGAVKPNPFNPSTYIDYDVPSDGGPVSLQVYDVRGALVATLVSGERPAGRHRATWNGRDARGKAMPSGLYLIRFQAGETTATRKLSLVR